MAGIALGREPVENAGRCLLVAFLALHCCMRPEKREAVLVILHLLDGDVPSLYGVALLAIRTHLAAVNVGVTVRAILSDACKNRLAMALDALHLLVHATQRIVGLVVVKLGNRTDRAPGGSRVAVLARHGQWTMWVAGSLFLRPRRKGELGTRVAREANIVRAARRCGRERKSQ